MSVRVQLSKSHASITRNNRATFLKLLEDKAYHSVVTMKTVLHLREVYQLLLLQTKDNTHMLHG